MVTRPMISRDLKSQVVTPISLRPQIFTNVQDRRVIISDHQ